VGWLLDLQNSDGGWPTFSRGWGTMPFDRSGCDLTAHALRALHAWREELAQLDERIGSAIERGFRFLAARQHASGSWSPLWFGDQYCAGEENPVYGTAKVLAAYRDLHRLDTSAARRGLDWLAGAAHVRGSWGGMPEVELGERLQPLNIEQTALATEALLSCAQTAEHEAAGMQGLKWLVDAVEANRHQEPSPIGFYFARLWYYEKLYPLVWTVAALGPSARQRLRPSEVPAVAHSKA
jgi:squalene-hopene/tetraprenyl-beta-curcumene cyclase